jgi:hypothetical protein
MRSQVRHHQKIGVSGQPRACEGRVQHAGGKGRIALHLALDIEIGRALLKDCQRIAHGLRFRALGRTEA